MCTRVANLKSTRTADNPYDVSFTATWSAGTPAVFGSMHTFDGGDPSHLRMDASSATGCTVFVEEETCSDAELAHTTEKVGIVAIQPNYLAPPPPPILETGSGLQNVLEVGTASAPQGVDTTIPFSGQYSDPVLIGGVASHNADDAAVVRIRGDINPVDKTFQMYLDVPNRCGDAGHPVEEFGWLMIERGVYTDQALEAGYGTCKCSRSLCVFFRSLNRTAAQTASAPAVVFALPSVVARAATTPPVSTGSMW